MSKKRYYLAYGSNLNPAQMHSRCPGAKPIGYTMLPGFELVFKGSRTGYYLTIEPKKAAGFRLESGKSVPTMNEVLTATRVTPSATTRRSCGCRSPDLPAAGRSRRTLSSTSCTKIGGSDCRPPSTFSDACEGTAHSVLHRSICTTHLNAAESIHFSERSKP